jgi:hypothetical protein
MTDLLTARETAALLRCSLRTLDRDRAEGRGCPFLRMGGRIRYRKVDIESFIVAHLRSHRGEAEPLAKTGAERPRSRPKSPKRRSA